MRVDEVPNRARHHGATKTVASEVSGERSLASVAA